jgi:monofunctional biosynthetic peptidoglycan transglycosylase
VRRLLAWSAVAVLVATVLPIAFLRVVPPVTTPFMLARRVPFARGPAACRSIAYRWVPARRIARDVLAAVVAAEDQNFTTHHGFDLGAIHDALEEGERGGRLRGASTISQQVAKNLFLWPGRSWVRKGLEAWFTIWIEALWPKWRILEVYVNVAQLGPCTFGVGAASRRYFDRSPRELTLDQAALLAAVLPNPVRRRVQAPSARVRERARWIATQARVIAGTSRVPEPP